MSFKAGAPPASPQPWGEISKYSPEVFSASDLSAGICDEVTTALLAAAAEWGNYGPLEYWVLGAEEQATRALTEFFCDRRYKRNHSTKESCLKKQKYLYYGFESYRKIGAEAIANIKTGGKTPQSAGWNGIRSWGIHFFASSLPIGLTDKFKLPGEGEQKTIFHEYFHAVQESYIKTIIRQKIPIWFTEGGA